MKFSIELEIEVTKTESNNWKAQWVNSGWYSSSSLEIALVACAKDIQKNISSEWLSIKMIEAFRSAERATP